MELCPCFRFQWKKSGGIVSLSRHVYAITFLRLGGENLYP